MYYKITIESSETGTVSVGVESENIGIINIVEALAALFDSLGLNPEEAQFLSDSAAALMRLENQTVKLDVGEFKKQMGEEDG